jgi:hypothetical protein
MQRNCWFISLALLAYSCAVPYPSSTEKSLRTSAGEDVQNQQSSPACLLSESLFAPCRFIVLHLNKLNNTL